MSGAATTAALIRAATRHKLTTAEWTVFCLLATEPNFKVRWQLLLRLIAGNHSNEYRRQVGLTDAGLRKGLLALETRGWVQVERGNRWGQHPEVYLVELLPVIVQQWPVDDDGAGFDSDLLAVRNARSVAIATKPPARGTRSRTTKRPARKDPRKGGSRGS